MQEEPALPVARTHSGREARGTILGLEGKTVVPVLISGVASTLMCGLSVLGDSETALAGMVASWIPTLLTLAWVVLLVHRKPPHFARDAFEWWMTRLPLAGPWLFPGGVALHVRPWRRSDLIVNQAGNHVRINSRRVFHAQPTVLRK